MSTIAWIAIFGLYVVIGALFLVSSARILSRDDRRSEPPVPQDDESYARPRGHRSG